MVVLLFLDSAVYGRRPLGSNKCMKPKRGGFIVFSSGIALALNDHYDSSVSWVKQVHDAKEEIIMHLYSGFLSLGSNKYMMSKRRS